MAKEPQSVDITTDIRYVWLKTMTGILAQDPDPSTQNALDLQKRKEGLDVIGKLGADKKQEIRAELLKIDVTVKKGIFTDKTKKLLAEDGDYRKEVDTWHHGKEITESLTSEQGELVQKQLMEVYAVYEELKSNEYYFPKKPDYPPIPDYDLSVLTGDALNKAILELDQLTKEHEKLEAEYLALKKKGDKALADDYWTPLVREGIVPESRVPDDYSEVFQLFDAASSAYDERLLEYSETLGDNDELLAKFEFGFKVGQATLKVLGEVAGLTGDIGDLQENEGLSEGAAQAKDFIDNLSIALTLTEGVIKAALTDRDFTTIGQEIAGVIADKVGAAAGIDATAKTIIVTVVNNGARVTSVAKLVKEGDYKGAFEAVVEGIAEELEAFDPVDGGGLMSQIAENLTMAAGSLTSLDKLAGMVQQKKSPAEILAFLLSAVDDVAGDALAGLTAEAAEKLNKAISGESEKPEAPSKEGDTTAEGEKEEGEAEEDEDDDDEEDDDDDEEEEDPNKILKKKFTLADLEKRREEAEKAAQDRMIASMEEQAKADEAQFQMHLRAGFPLANDDDDEVNISEFERVHSIEYLLAVQKKNEATFNLCKQIATKGVGLITKMFPIPGAGLVQACLLLTFTIKDAVEKTEEMIVWRENVADAKAAVSAQVDAMLNRSGLQTKQAMQANVQVALDAAKVVAEALALTPAAPAAPIVKSSVSVVEASIELADLIYTEAQLRKAWKLYQQARDVPQDRYLARKATRENPTLSKYAMAYGAMNGDPIAMEGMRRCGLDKTTLSLPDTNVGKVVGYLEAKYADDPVLLRAVPVPEKWYPGPVELTARSWMTFYRMATTKAKPALDPGGDTSGISASLGKLETALVEFEKAMEATITAAALVTAEEDKANPIKVDDAARVTLTSTLIKLKDQLGKYTPKTVPEKGASSAHHAEMAKYVDALVAQSERKLLAVTKLMESKPWTKKFKKATETETVGG